MKPVLPELGVPSSEPGRIQSLESMPTLPGSGEAGVSFDLPAQADTLHSANKVMHPPLPAFFFLNQNNLYVSSKFITYLRKADSSPSIEGGALSFLPSP